MTNKENYTELGANEQDMTSPPPYEQLVVDQPSKAEPRLHYTNPPPTYLGYAIFTTICCCWPLGVFAILRAAEAKASIARGDPVAAKRHSRSAARFSHLALAIGIVLLAIMVYVTFHFNYFIRMEQLDQRTLQKLRQLHIPGHPTN